MTDADKIAAAPPFYTKNDAHRWARRNRVKVWDVVETRSSYDGSRGFRMVTA